MELPSFIADHLGQKPLAMPGSARRVGALFDWETLERILRAEPAADVLVIARGKLIEQPVPRSLEEVRALLREGKGLVIRRAERNDRGLAALAAAFVKDLPGEAHIQLFITPGGTHGFSWHYDFEEVFIAQTAGIKDYFFRENTADPATPRGTNPDFTRVRDETTPTGTARLVPGDWLYLPARWWHVAVCVEDSLSISLGVYPTGASKS
jgi:50S ribosomal protein L16 3-hydroxylase